MLTILILVLLFGLLCGGPYYGAIGVPPYLAAAVWVVLLVWLITRIA